VPDTLRMDNSAQSSPTSPRLLRISGNTSRSSTPISSRNPSPMGTLRRGATPSIHEAISAGELSKVREHVQKGGDINLRQGNGHSTMLHVASFFDQGKNELTRFSHLIQI
jgi:hypothetical protein